MMKYKAVLFDMDGTLLDTLADMAAAVNHILSVHGYPLRTVEEVRAFVGNGARKLMERALPPDVTGDAFEALLEEYRQWYEAHACVRTAPYPGVPAVLAALHRAGVRCAVVSNKPDGATRELAARFFPGLPAFGQQDGIPAKPAPDMVYHALAELGVEASAAAYVATTRWTWRWPVTRACPSLPSAGAFAGARRWRRPVRRWWWTMPPRCWKTCCDRRFLPLTNGQKRGILSPSKRY